jgi:uncharacterized protein (TIGR04222 family)
LTGVVRLIGRKVLVAGVAGVLSETRDVVGMLDSVEREALYVAQQPRVFRDMMLHIEWQLKQSGVIRQLSDELTAMGYMRDRWSTAWWTHYVWNMLPFAVLNAIVAGSLVGLAMPADTQDWLTSCGVFSVVAMLIVALPGRVTALGRYVVWCAMQHHPDLRTARAIHGDALDIKALGQAVALYGPGALAGSDMAWIQALLAQRAMAD